ncbi:hypothetical protein DVH24_002631 [Malus domestica]|uniref:Uncharacterized protein n=1 Tax=Malus domestica TaxID=3750 RepID=A0A498KAK8_MALDO|nr:hypothetical protein DVH24_002631 [Malus domestica]
MTLAGVYGFWKYASKLERRETRRYLEMFHILKFRDLVLLNLDLAAQAQHCKGNDHLHIPSTKSIKSRDFASRTVLLNLDLAAQAQHCKGNDHLHIPSTKSIKSRDFDF